VELFDALVLGPEVGAHFIQNQACSEHVSLVRHPEGFILLPGLRYHFHGLLRGLIHGRARAERGLSFLGGLLASEPDVLLEGDVLALHEGGLLLLLLEVLLRLDFINLAVLLQVGYTEVGSLQPLDFLREFFVGLLGQAKVADLEGHPRFVDEDVVWLYVPVDEAFLMDVLQALEDLLEEYADVAAVRLVVLAVKVRSQGVMRAVLHLNHDVQRDEGLLLLHHLAQRTVGVDTH